MELVELKQRDHLTREQAAERLHDLADQLARHNDVEFHREGVSFRVHVPDEVDVEVELEVEDDGCELEIELSW